MSDRWDEYRQNRRGAIVHLTQELKEALEAMLPKSPLPAVDQELAEAAKPFAETMTADEPCFLRGKEVI